MTHLDLAIAGFALFMALWGYSQGLIVGALSLGGFGAGALLGSRLGPVVLSGGSHSPYAPLFALVGGLMIGGFVASILELLGLHLRERLRGVPGRLDGAAGAALLACLGLGLAWIAGAAALQTPGAGKLRREIQRSKLLQALNRELPPSGPLLNALARFDPLPTVSGPQPRVRRPDARIARDPDVRRARASVVRVLGTACGLGVEGSGWIARGGLVVTNAHVVAGQDDTTVQVGGGGQRFAAHAVAFDPRNDVALLASSGTAGVSGLRLRAAAPLGTSAAILGFPRNGPFDVEAGRLGRTVVALSEDAYGRGPVSRRLTALRGLVRPGNSGGPMVDSAGRVVTTIFAATVGRRQRSGLGVPASIVGAALRRHGPADREVDTGPCAR